MRKKRAQDRVMIVDNSRRRA